MSFKNSIEAIREYRKDPLAYISKLYERDGHRSILDIFSKKLFVISDPKDVLYFLKENHANYPKGRTYKVMKELLGNGLITSEGDFWRKQHRMIRPLMNPKGVYELFAPKILDTTLEFAPLLDGKTPVDSFFEMNRLTWRIVVRTLFSQEATPEMDEWLKDILFVMGCVTERTRAILPVPFWIPTPKHTKIKASVGKFDAYIYQLMKERREGEKKRDLLQLLIDAKEEDIERMTESEIRDEILTFLMAGHETVTNTLSWALILLAKNPAYFAHLQKEAAAFFETKNIEELNTMPWLSAVLDEVMRMWPPVWAFMRQATANDRLGDVLVPAKSNVVILPFISHRSKELWERPLDFYPERFLPHEKKKIPPGAFYPFGVGPRACIGSYFASVETKIVLATLVHHYEWSILKEDKQTYEAGITLRPTNNTIMNFRKRTC